MIQKKTEHGEVEFGRRRCIEILPGTSIWIASPEDVILKKLQFYQEGRSQKHLVDCKAMLNQGPVDELYLGLWVEKLRLEEEWQELLGF